MAKIYLDSESYRKTVIDQLTVASTKLESAARECSLLYIPSGFRYYSYLANLKGIIMDCNKRCNDVLGFANDSISRWEVTKNNLLALSRKIDIKTVQKRNNLIK